MKLAVYQYISYYKDLWSMSREAAKKNPPLMVGPLRGGGGVKAGPLRKKTFFETFLFCFVGH